MTEKALSEKAETANEFDSKPELWRSQLQEMQNSVRERLAETDSSRGSLPVLELYQSEHAENSTEQRQTLVERRRRSPWDEPATGAGIDSKAKDEKERLHGINLCGAEFGAQSLPGRLGTDYIFPTTQELDFYKSKGMNLVRLPFLWERMQPGLLQKQSADANVDRSFDPVYAGQMENFLRAADERGMKVVLDAQQFGRYNNQVIGVSKITTEDFKQFWKQMAERFGKHKSIEGWDLSNEPHDQDNKTWQAAAQAGLDGVRAAGDKNTVIVEGNNWAGAHAWEKSNEDMLVHDPADNVVYSAHSYWDRDHSGTYSGGPQASYNMAVEEAKKSGFLMPGEDPANMGINYIKPFLNWLKRHNARGYIGEYGVPTDDPNWVKVQDKFLSFTRQNKINTTAWAGGPWWGSAYTLGLEKGPVGEQSVNGRESPGLSSIIRDGN